MSGLLGRDEQTRVIAGVLDRRGAAVVAVVARRGRGTSSLLAWAAREAAARGFQVLSATGHPDERDLDGLGLHQLLRPLGGPSIVPTGADARAQLRSAARRGPVLVVVDDLHLLDDASGAVLDELVEDLRHEPVAFLTGGRALPGAAEVTLPPLPAEIAAGLLARQPGAPRGRGRLELLRRARGNPRALLDLAAAFAGASSDDVVRPPLARLLPIRRRHEAELAALSPAALRLIRQVSARLPGDADEGRAEVLAAAGEAAAAELATVLATGLIEEHDGSLRFADPMVGLTAYTSCPAADRNGLHRAFADVLGPGSLPHALHLAAAATAPSESIAAAIERFADPIDHFGYACALQRAAELSPRPEDAERRYAAALHAASTLGQTTWVLELFPLAARNPVTVRAAALAHSRSGRQREAMDLLAGADDNRLDGFWRAAAAAHVARVSGLPEHRAAVAELTARAERLPDGPPAVGNPLSEEDLPLLRHALAANADPWAPLGPVVIPPGPHPPTRALILAVVADAAGDIEAAIRLRRDAVTAAAPEMWPPLLAGVLDRGDLGDATELIRECRAVCAGADLPLLESEVAAIGALRAAQAGDLDRARRLTGPAFAAVDPHQNLRLQYHLAQALGAIAFAEGDFSSAYRHYRRLFGADGRAVYPDLPGHLLLGLAVVAPHADRAADAARALRSYEPAGNNRMRLNAHHARARLIEDGHTEEHFRRAVDDPDGESWVFDRALARLHYGGWLRRHRRPLEARGQLSAALEGLERIGAAGLAAMARVELGAAGETAVEQMPEALSRLSPQQRQIVRLAAGGLRNREIAAQLRVSPRTVGTHLYNAYPKLGVRGRRELGALLHG